MTVDIDKFQFFLYDNHSRCLCGGGLTFEKGVDLL